MRPPTLCFFTPCTCRVVITWGIDCSDSNWDSDFVSFGNGRQLNLLEVYVARRDRRWLSTQWLKIYTGSDNLALHLVNGRSDVLLEPGARESLGCYKLSNGEWISWILVPFPRRLTLLFIVQGGPHYRGTKCREREIERVPCPVDWGCQPY
jgi:hypothetical protein